MVTISVIPLYVLSYFNSARTVNGHFEFHTDRHALPRSLAAANSPSDWNEALENITLGSPEQVIWLIHVVTFLSYAVSKFEV